MKIKLPTLTFVPVTELFIVAVVVATLVSIVKQKSFTTGIVLNKSQVMDDERTKHLFVAVKYKNLNADYEVTPEMFAVVNVGQKLDFTISENKIIAATLHNH